MIDIQRGKELNNCAISIAKILKMVAEIEPNISDADDLYKNKEGILILAYISRVTILDRIENNPWMVPEQPIRIATGLFSIRKETIASALSLTVGRIIKIAEYDMDISDLVDDILKKGDAFYDLKNLIPSLNNIT
jgi:hypothetical protein